MTTWLPYANPAPREWVLTDGEILTEPALQITEGGRRMRVADTKHAFWSKDVNDGIRKYMAERAQQRGANLWFVKTEHPKDPGSVAVEHMDAAKLFEEALQRHGEKTLTTFFKDDQYGLVAQLSVRLGRAYYRDGSYSVTIQGAINATDPDSLVRRPKVHDLLSGGKAVESVQGVPLVQAAAKTLTLVNIIDQPSIEVSVFYLDAAGEERERVVTLDSIGSNYSSNIRADLREIVDRGLDVQEIKRLYKEMREVFLRTGIVLSTDIETDQFLLALVATDNPENVGVIATVEAAPNKSDGESSWRSPHTLGIDLLNGTFYIECSKPLTQDALHAYEMAKMREELTGHTGEIESYIRAYSVEHLGRKSAQMLRMEEQKRRHGGVSAREGNDNE